MNEIVNIAGVPHSPMHFNKATVLAMMEAGLLPDDRKVEMIDGVLIEMSPANNDHGVALSYLIVAIGSRIPKSMKGATDVAIFLADNLMLAPDFAILPKPIRTEDASGDDLILAVEIGDSTISRDLTVKAEKYALHDVPELWVVDLPDRKLHIHRKPSAQGYQSVSVHDWHETLTPLGLPDVDVTLDDVIEL